MSFTIQYHKDVISDDIPDLPKKQRAGIKRAIEERLTTNPEIYGKPLRKSLKGFRKLKVGEYRIVFRIEGKTVKIFVIRNRSVVYEKYDIRYS